MHDVRAVAADEVTRGDGDHIGGKEVGIQVGQQQAGDGERSWQVELRALKLRCCSRRGELSSGEGEGEKATPSQQSWLRLPRNAPSDPSPSEAAAQEFRHAAWLQSALA